VEVEIRQSKLKEAGHQETRLLVIEVSPHDVMGLQVGPRRGAWARQIQLVDKVMSEDIVDTKISTHKRDIIVRYYPGLWS
jgi:hypothetical protein